MHEMFKRNLFFKIASVVMALLLWLWVTNQNITQASLNGEQSLNIPLEIRAMPSDLVLMSKLPSTVRIRLVGVNTVSTKDLYAYIDLSEGTTGEHSYTVQIEPISGVSVWELEPKLVTVTLDGIQEKVLPVNVNVTGTPASGYNASAALVKPTAINVRGPASILATLDKVVTDISIDGASESINVTRPVTIRDNEGNTINGPDPVVNVFSFTPDNVQVIIPIISKSQANKRIPLKATSTGNPATGMTLRSLTVSPDSILVYGSVELLKTFDDLSVGPVDVTGLAEDKVFSISTEKLNLPQGVTTTLGTSLTVVADVGPVVADKMIAAVPVEVRNLADGLELEQPSPVLEITVRAYPEVLAGLNADQFKLWVEAGGFGVGAYPNTTLYWQLPAGVEMIGSPQLSLSVKAKS